MADKFCFVIMPFGDKPEGVGSLDFDTIYELMIKPSVYEAGLDCVRSDEIGRPGWIHAEMINQIYAADVAVVDITTLNPNVFYELGVRHALRPAVTVLIRKKTTEIPFNIQGLNLIEYEPENIRSVDETKKKITAFIRAGLASSKTDSLVHSVIDLRIGTATKAARKSETDYELRDASNKSICIIGGDIKNVKNVDIWVSSENTNMQMARFFDRSVSSMIRYLGAAKDEAGHVTQDVIANELAEKLGMHATVHPATVIATGAGELATTHGVRYIFHAAAVSGAVGQGYVPIPNITDCIVNALAKADSSPYTESGSKSIVFPLLGTGTARGDLHLIVGRLIDTAISYLTENPDSGIERACFVAWSEEELVACRRFVDSSSALGSAG